MDNDSLENSVREEHVRAVREGHGANCSSVGSVVDTLFVGAVAGGALLTLIAAAMMRERVRVVGAQGRAPDADLPERSAEEENT